MTAKDDMPTHISRDEYTGVQTVMLKPSGYRVSVYTAGELADMIRNGVQGTFWDSFGNVNGVECFARNRFLPGPNGELYGYDADGALKVIHPADRELRILCRR